MDFDQLIRDVDPARHLEIDPPDPRSITERRSLRRQRSISGLALVASVGVVVGVVVVLLGVRGQQPAAPSQPIRSPARQPSSVTQPLVAKLGVLRQPQTPDARAFNHTLTGRPPHFVIDPELTHLVRLAHGIRVWLYVVTAGQHGERGLGISERGGGGNQRRPQVGFGECCTSPAELERPGSPGPLASSSAPHAHQVYIEVVPDGVARVRWTFPRRPSVGRTPHTSRLGPFAHPLTTTVIVHHNIAAAVLPDRWAAQTVVWYGASGRIVASHTGH
ncbi:MAG: hypothetical protein ACRDYZ_08880 [Acidimicrobiales bacterium]